VFCRYFHRFRLLCISRCLLSDVPGTGRCGMSASTRRRILRRARCISIMLAFCLSGRLIDSSAKTENFWPDRSLKRCRHAGDMRSFWSEDEPIRRVCLHLVRRRWSRTRRWRRARQGFKLQSQVSSVPSLTCLSPPLPLFRRAVISHIFSLAELPKEPPD